MITAFALSARSAGHGSAVPGGLEVKATFELVARRLIFDVLFEGARSELALLTEQHFGKVGVGLSLATEH